MSSPRGEFSSRFGFLMAAAGSAVGLGNIWGFPTNAAQNGGAAFLIVYLILTFALAYPALMAELIIGRHAKANAVQALGAISGSPNAKRFGLFVAFGGIVTVCFILSFYAIVSGWMLAFFIEPIIRLLGYLGFSGASEISLWLTEDTTVRNTVFTLLFMIMTVLVIQGGVKDGIEKWSSRLMPSLVLILFALIAYVLTLDGAMEGLRAYLVPDLSRLFDSDLIKDALGQAFFSLSLGVGTMLIYGSYVSKKENLPLLGSMVALLDVGIAVTAGLLIIPAMYVAAANGVVIFDDSGALISGPGLIVAVLPALFNTMGAAGGFVAFTFFALMSIASLTSSISMLEVPVSYAVEEKGLQRKKATLLIGSFITLICLIIVFNFDQLFGLVITITTEYSQPVLSLFFCIFAAWIWSRNGILEEIKLGYPEAGNSLFWKIWPVYIKFVCPVAIILVYYKTIFG